MLKDTIKLPKHFYYTFSHKITIYQEGAVFASRRILLEVGKKKHVNFKDIIQYLEKH